MTLNVVFLIVGVLAFLNKDTVASKISMLAPTMGNSPYFGMLRLAEELLSRGHEVQVILSKQIRQRKSDVKHILYNDTLPKGTIDIFIKKTIAKGAFSLTDMAKAMHLLLSGCDDLLRDDKAITEFRNSDVIVGISIFACTAVIAEYVEKPFILLHPAAFPALASFLQVPMPTSYVPCFHSRLTEDMTFYERVLNVGFSTVKDIIVRLVLSQKYKPIQSKYDVHTDKSITDLIGMAQIHIIQSDFALEFVHPLMPNTFYVGPLTPKPAEPLPENFEQVMRSSKVHGTVLVSFGSQISELNDEMVETMATAFGKLKQTVIWRIKLPERIKVNKNIKTFSWIPQNDILGHSNIRAFVSHMGANGANEAGYHGVPVVAVPFMSDGYDNALRLTQKGKMAKFMDLYTADVDTWVRTIEEVVYNTQYKNNATRVSKLMRTFPRSPPEKAADLVDYVLDNGGRVPHLRAYAYNLTWYQYHNIDVLVFLFVVVSVLILVICRLIRCCCGLCKKRSNNMKTKKQ